MTNEFYIVDDLVFIKLLRKGNTYWTVIDLVDLNRVNKTGVTWYIADNGRNKYVYTSINSKVVMLHNKICRNVDRTFQEVDHINCIGLDNRRENLQVVTKQQNKLLASIRNRSGVSYARKEDRWYAQVKINYKLYAKGFKNKESAEQLCDILHKLCIINYLYGIQIGEIDDELAINGSIISTVIGLSLDSITIPDEKPARRFRENIFYRGDKKRWIVSQRVGNIRIYKTCLSRKDAIRFADILELEVAQCF